MSAGVRPLGVVYVRSGYVRSVHYHVVLEHQRISSYPITHQDHQHTTMYTLSPPRTHTTTNTHHPHHHEHTPPPHTPQCLSRQPRRRLSRVSYSSGYAMEWTFLRVSALKNEPMSTSARTLIHVYPNSIIPISVRAPSERGSAWEKQ